MRAGNLFFLLFILAAFTLGVTMEQSGVEKELMDSALDNASMVFHEVELGRTYNESQIPNLNGFMTVIEEGIQFVGVLSIEVLRAGIYFGHDNPDYFEPEFLISIIKLIIILVILSLLIQPAFYLIIFIVMAVIWIKDKLKERKKGDIKDKSAPQENQE